MDGVQTGPPLLYIGHTLDHVLVMRSVAAPTAIAPSNDPQARMVTCNADWDGGILLTSRTARPLVLSFGRSTKEHALWVAAGADGRRGSSDEAGQVILHRIWHGSGVQQADDSFFLFANTWSCYLCLVQARMPCFTLDGRMGPFLHL